MKRILPFAVMLIAAACSDQAAPFAPTAESESVLLASRTAEANGSNASKVGICHVDGKGSYRLINVSGNAKQAHLNHGDGLPGEDGLRADCSVAADPFRFIDASYSTVVGEESLFQLVWTVTGTPGAVSFDVQFCSLDRDGNESCDTQESVDGGVYASGEYYGTGKYQIVARLDDGSSMTSGPINIP